MRLRGCHLLCAMEYLLPLLSRFKPYLLLHIPFYPSNYELLANVDFRGVTFENSRVAPKKTRDPPLFSLQKVLKLNKVSQKIGMEKTTWVLITPRYSLNVTFLEICMHWCSPQIAPKNDGMKMTKIQLLKKCPPK